MKRLNMMWEMILLGIGAAVVGYVLITRSKKAEAADVTYVCNVCNERDCVCHKEERDENEVN